MTVKKILIPFLEEQSARLAFESALPFAKKDDAHIAVIHMRRRPVPPVTVFFPLGGGSTELTEAFFEAENELAGNLQRLFGELCEANAVGVVDIAAHAGAHGATASWSDEEGDIFADIPSMATAADLTIFAFAKEDPSPFERTLLEEVLFRSGRPVLLCPHAGVQTLPKRIVIAWNGREEAARVVGAGLGFLQDAEAVKVLTVRKAEAPPVNTDDITAYLRLHGADVTETEIELEQNQDEIGALDEQIREFKADMILMGAYSHSRWRESVLGGYTSHILSKSTVPALMMH